MAIKVRDRQLARHLPVDSRSSGTPAQQPAAQTPAEPVRTQGGGGAPAAAVPAQVQEEQRQALTRADVGVAGPGAFQAPGVVGAFAPQTGLPEAFNPQTGQMEAFNPQTGLPEGYRARGVIGNYDPAADAAYQEAMTALRNAQARLPGYDPSYGDSLADLYAQITGRQPYSYDLDADMLYQQYRQQYTRQGQQAMRDTMGQAAGLTGGYGSSYAQSAGQQQYNAYLQQLNDRIPELEQRAFERWQAEGDDLYRQYSLTRDLADDEYAKYRDQVTDYWRGVDFADQQAQQAYGRGVDYWNRAYALDNEAQQRAADEWARNYQRNQDAYSREAEAWERNYQLNQDAYNRELQAYNLAYQRNQDAYGRELDAWNLERQRNADEYSRAADQWARDYQLSGDAYSRQEDERARLMQLMSTTGYQPTEEDLRAAGMTTGEADAWSAYIAAQNAPSGGGGGRRDETETEAAEQTPENDGSITYSSVYRAVKDMTLQGADADSIQQFVNEAAAAGGLSKSDKARLSALIPTR